MIRKVSIIVACYNVEEYIEECINSIANQSYTNIEIIAINDESKDSTLEKIIVLASKDKRIRVINQKNKGLSGLRNEGISLATGTYLMFVDGDDWLHKDCLKQLMEYSDQYDLICCSYFKVFRNETEVRKLNLSGEYSSVFIQRRMIGLQGEELSDPSQADSIVTAWAKLYRISLLRQFEIKFTDTKLIGTEDALFNITYLQYATNSFIIDLPLYYYRKYNANSLTNTYKANLFTQWKLLFSMIYKYVENKGIDFEKAFNTRIALSIIGLGLNEIIGTHGFVSKYSKLKMILKDPIYIKAYGSLDVRYFPVHWRIFFLLTKYRFVIGLYIMLKMISKILKNKN